MQRLRAISLLVLALPVVFGFAGGALNAETSLFPLKDVKPGLRGVGKTVFAGTKVEDFDVEVLGVLENEGPRQSIILARLSHPQLERAGVLQGMSGSPVYIDGKLMGAVALAFQFSKEPIGGIRPIEDMLTVAGPSIREQPRAKVRLSDRQLTHLFPAPVEVLSGGSRMVEIATPLSFSGFTRRTIEEFTPQMRGIGLEPAQGLSGGGRPRTDVTRPPALEPGSMISVQLLSGDLSIGADGTVTHIDGNKIYAFGHRFLSVGETELPFAKADVLTLLPNLMMSFKVSTAREWAGTLTGDYSTAVAGELGRKASMVPLAISVAGEGRGAGQPERKMTYSASMVNDRYLAPFLLQMAVYSAIDATERTLGTGTLQLKGQIEFEGTDPIQLDDMYAGEGNVPMQVSLAAAIPMAYLLQSGFEDLKLKNVALSVRTFDEKKAWQIEQVWPSRRTARPGESIDLTIVLTGKNGAEQVKKATYRVPVGARPGALYFTVADGTITNFTEFQGLLGKRLRSANQVVSFLNKLRSNTNVYVRAWRFDTSYVVQGRNLPQPPPSVSLVLGKGQAALSGADMAYTSEVTDFTVGVGDAVVSGSKTIQVEIKE